MFSWKNKSIDLENVDKRKLFNNAGAYGLLTLAVGAMAFFGMCQPSQNNYVGPKGAAATSALFIWVNSLAGLGGATLSGQLTLEWGVLFPFVSAVLIGGFIGSRYGAEIAPQQMVRKLLVIVLVVAAVRRVVELF